MPTVALPIQTFINVSTLSLSVTVEWIFRSEAIFNAMMKKMKINGSAALQVRIVHVHQMPTLSAYVHTDVA